jgi:hypothetical protein
MNLPGGRIVAGARLAPNGRKVQQSDLYRLLVLNLEGIPGGEDPGCR